MIGLGRAPCDEGVIRAAAETSGCDDRARPWVLAATILGSAMAFIDGSVVNVALPAMQADLDASIGGAPGGGHRCILPPGAPGPIRRGPPPRCGPPTGSAPRLPRLSPAAVGGGPAP